MSEPISLVELTDHTGFVHRFCTGSTAWTSLPTDNPPNAYYAPRVEQAGLTRQSMFAKGTTSGSSTGGKGDIVLRNSDGGLDHFVDLGFDGQLCVVKDGTRDMVLSQFATVLSGTVEQPELSFLKVTLLWKDYAALLNTPIQTLHYLGNNVGSDGIEGGPELKDKLKPRLKGNPGINLKPVCVNTAKLVYQVNAYGPVYDIPAVHIGGNVGQIIQGANYATSAELLAVILPLVTDPPSIPGIYITCLAEGLFRLDGNPIGDVTCEAIEGATAADRTAGQIIKALAIEKLGEAQVAAQPVLDLDKAAPYQVGIYADTNETSYSQAFESLCGDVGGWWGFDNLSIFWVKQLTPPTVAQAIMTLDPSKNEYIKIDRVATADGDHGVPVCRVFVEYSKNWTLQTSGLAGSSSSGQLWYGPDTVTPPNVGRHNLLSMEYLRTKAENLAVLDVHKNAPTLTIKTTLNTQADADTEAARILALRSVRRDRLNIKLPIAAIQYSPLGDWDNEAITELPTTTAFTDYAIYTTTVYIYDVTYGRFMYLDLLNPQGHWHWFGTPAYPTNGMNLTTNIIGNYIYAIGGISGGFGNKITRRLDLTGDGTWDNAGVAELLTGVGLHAAVVYDNDVYGYHVLICIGGIDESASATDTVQVLDITNPASPWGAMLSLPHPRFGHTGEVHGDWIIVIGGDELTFGITSRILVYDFAAMFSQSWDATKITPLPSPRVNHASCIIDNYLYVAGGEYPYYTHLTSVIRLDLRNPLGAWELVSDLPYPRSNLCIAGINKSIFAFGGYAGANEANSWKLRSNDTPEDKSQLTSLGRTVLVKHPRYGYSDGRPMKIIGSESDLKNRMMTLEVWG
ncbi:MAG: hypothetical protein A2076_13200 [Geobacteraceae bacterium GWC2_53_11]|nr:MAG: hypothetical protein A2076_13200 [Geobacteraceae bacterium GWC2_53_11]